MQGIHWKWKIHVICYVAHCFTVKVDQNMYCQFPLEYENTINSICISKYGESVHNYQIHNNQIQECHARIRWKLTTHIILFVALFLTIRGHLA